MKDFFRKHNRMQIFICHFQNDDQLIDYSANIYMLLWKISILVALLRSPSSKYGKHQACYRTQVQLVTGIVWWWCNAHGWMHLGTSIVHQCYAFDLEDLTICGFGLCAGKFWNQPSTTQRDTYTTNTCLWILMSKNEANKTEHVSRCLLWTFVRVVRVILVFA